MVQIYTERTPCQSVYMCLMEIDLRVSERNGKEAERASTHNHLRVFEGPVLRSLLLLRIWR